jgi:predicted metal-dependent enzyme (double-stranded beta helix superfamily)
MAAGPGYLSGIHDHRCWGLVGQLQGCELEIRYRRGDFEAGDAPVSGGVSLWPQETRRLTPGSVTEIGPLPGDLHQVANIAEGPSVTLHAFTRNVMREGFHVYRPVLYQAQLITQRPQ